MRIQPRTESGFRRVGKAILTEHPKRTILGMSLFIGQAFLYNAIFFTYALVLTTFYKVSSGSIGLYLIAFAAGNLLGPILLGRLFDVVGRRVMISGCYLLSGVMLAATAWPFDRGVLSATTQTVAWVVVFFFASAGASAAYLKVSEIFPMETRALAIALFFAVGTGVGGIIGPVLFGHLIQSKRPSEVTIGYLIGAGLMCAAGLVEALLGIDAERKSLEEAASPLSTIESGGPSTASRGEPSKDREGPARSPIPRSRARRLGWAPLPQASTYPHGNPYLERELNLIVAALARRGPLTFAAISLEVGGRFWGPGRVRDALRLATAAGVVRRLGRDLFVASEERVEPPEQGLAVPASVSNQDVDR